MGDNLQNLNSQIQELIDDRNTVPNCISENMMNFKMPELQTYEDRIRPLTQRMDSMKQELESQTSELQKLHNENIKLNSEVEKLNRTNNRQLSEITDLKSNEIVSKNTILSLRQEINNLTKTNKWSTLKGVLIGVCGTVIGGLILNYIVTII